jgi:hypothetical protein
LATGMFCLEHLVNINCVFFAMKEEEKAYEIPEYLHLKNILVKKNRILNLSLGYRK